MKKTVLVFPTIDELRDFEQVVGSKEYIVDRHNISLAGLFSDREIELARNGFEAVVTE